MMKDLFEAEPAAREIYAKAEECLSRSLSWLSFEGTQEELNLTHNTQPTVLAADLAAAAVLRAHGIAADAAAGFSLGEYAALSFAGVLSAEDCFKLIQIRADAMQAAVAPGDGAMAAFVGAAPEKVEEICARVTDAYVAAANYNSPIQTVVSGSAAGVDRACGIADAEGIKSVRLAVSAPFHCALMEPAARRLEEEFRHVPFQAPQIPVYMNVDGKPAPDAGSIPDLLVRQAMSPVRWVQTLENMQADGIDTFIECGPGKTLSGLVKKTLRGVTVLRVENLKTLEDTLLKLEK